MIVTFCGHADYNPSAHHEKTILDLLEEKIGDRHAELYLGGYGSFDRFALLCGKRFQASHPNVKLIFISPYMPNDLEKNHLKQIVAAYDEIVYPPLERVPRRVAILRRNLWMVEHADLVVAYVIRSFGGAYQTLQHAQKCNKEIFELLP